MDTAMPLPKYHQIYLVREQLQEGRYDVDGVPGEHALAAQFQVARITIRKAMEMLVADGLVSRRPAWAPGRARRRVRYRARARAQKAQLTGLMENIVNMGLRTAVRVLDCVQVGAPPAVAEALEIAPGEPVIKSLRVRSTEAGPCPTSPRAAGRRSLHARGPGAPALADAAGVGRRRVRRRHADHQRPVGRRAGRAASGRGRGLGPAGRDAPGARRQGTSVQLLQGLYRPDRYQYQLQLSRVGGIDAKVWVSEELSAQFH